MSSEPQPDYGALIDLCERAAKGDSSAREALRSWFDSRVVAIREGKKSRDELGTLAYQVAVKRATRKLAPGGRFDDLPNSPESVGSLLWQRFQRFCEDIEKGKPKSLDDFIRRINALTKYVLLDLVERRKKEPKIEGPLGVAADSDKIARSDEPIGEMGKLIEQRSAFLHRVHALLPPDLFLVVILRDYCPFTWSEIAQILGETAYDVKKRHTEATREIGKYFS